MSQRFFTRRPRSRTPHPKVWQFWRERDGTLSSHGPMYTPPDLIVRAWTAKQAWFFGYNVESHVSSSRTDGCGVWMDAR